MMAAKVDYNCYAECRALQLVRWDELKLFILTHSSSSGPAQRPIDRD
ncbi:hypothetical protein [Mucilaginibacter ginsenosidivorax]|nr:hypothetical protein [Mucilaginibacter ginsenosidivorax]